MSDIHEAAKAGRVTKIRELCAKDPSQVRVLDQRGWTPLHRAAWWGHREAAEVLIAHGADPNAQSFKGVTPLHVAAHKGHKHVVKFLLEKGGDPTIRDYENSTPPEEAAHAGHEEVVKLFQQWEKDRGAGLCHD